jgi:hypothetical protein
MGPPTTHGCPRPRVLITPAPNTAGDPDPPTASNGCLARPQPNAQGAPQNQYTGGMCYVRRSPIISPRQPPQPPPSVPLCPPLFPSRPVPHIPLLLRIPLIRLIPPAAPRPIPLRRLSMAPRTVPLPIRPHHLTTFAQHCLHPTTLPTKLSTWNTFSTCPLFGRFGRFFCTRNAIFRRWRRKRRKITALALPMPTHPKQRATPPPPPPKNPSQ